MDDIYFEKINKDMVINREVYFNIEKIKKASSILKYISFNLKEEYTTNQIYDLIQVLRKKTSIIVTIFNPKIREVFIVFITDNKNSILDNQIKDFLELEEY